jgi:hypothetical protein
MHVLYWYNNVFMYLDTGACALVQVTDLMATAVSTAAIFFRSISGSLS